MVSDGGAINGLGYYGWVIASDMKILWEESGQVTGNPEQIDSLRAETHGTLAAVLFLTKLYEAGYL